ncbi:rna-dependent rna polymeras-like protein [Calycina marina]|uniref:RNA-dependent RNA polymerase n=1 Tax=Calycina marina TaxID=1763456 RepID=A0A9P7Z6H7_9HELO|nr:rna-dependent rna polymeras-like protein [Calycina marina]
MAIENKNGLRRFPKKSFRYLSIVDVHVEKGRSAPFAKLTFLNIKEANKFLNHYSMCHRRPPCRPSKAIDYAKQLTFLNQRIYFQKSKNEANSYLKRVLQKEKDERDTRGTAIPLRNDIPAKDGNILPVIFECSDVSFVIWNYSQQSSELRVRFGENSATSELKTISARFGDRAAILRLTTTDGVTGFVQRHVDFLYTGINDITADSGEVSSITLSMREPPRFFVEQLEDPMTELLRKLTLQELNSRAKFNEPSRHRVECLTRAHRSTAGHCLLREAHGIPPIISQYGAEVNSTEDYMAAFQALQEEISSFSKGFPFTLQFQIIKLAQNNYLPPSTVLRLLPEIFSITQRSTLSTCVGAVRHLFNQIDFPGPKSEGKDYQLDALINERSQNAAVIHRAKVIPTSILLSGPEPESTNRVLRKYPDNHDSFLRVTFCDEDRQPVRFSSSISNNRIFHGRFKNVLKSGVKIGDRHFEYLSFFHFSLRSQTVWFMAPFVHNGSLVDARFAIGDLGDFSLIFSPAKCAARIGQVFSDTPTSVKIDPTAFSRIPDVERNERVFSDGVGTMSTEVMGKKKWDRLSKFRGAQPTCFQIRCGGAKGMIACDPTVGEVLRIRESMINFEATKKTDIEICEGAWKPLPLYLNRQLIKILEDMGVNPNFFLDLQAKEVARLRLITASPYNASTFLRHQNIGEAFNLPWLINKLSALGIDFRTDGFLRDVAEMSLLNELRQIKHKTRIPVSRDVICMALVCKNILIPRAPCLHPGDIQIVDAVQPPAGSSLFMLSGGDLDVDRYYIIWDPAAKPTKRYAPSDYPRKEPIDIGRIITQNDMTDFFIRFMETDQLGRIAIAHRVFADQKDDGTLNKDCLTLSEMHYTAVDFSKTGIPVDITMIPRTNRLRPDFEVPDPHVTIKYRYYESEKVLGRLYRNIDERAIFAEIQAHAHAQTSTDIYTHGTMKEVWSYIERTYRLVQWEHLKTEAKDIMEGYEDCMQESMIEYTEHPSRPLTELEVFVGNGFDRTGSHNRRLRELSTSLKEYFGDHGTRLEEALEKSIACLAVSLEKPDEPRRGWKGRTQLLSFRYVAAALCLKEVERLLPTVWSPGTIY